MGSMRTITVRILDLDNRSNYDLIEMLRARLRAIVMAGYRIHIDIVPRPDGSPYPSMGKHVGVRAITREIDRMVKSPSGGADNQTDDVDSWMRAALKRQGGEEMEEEEEEDPRGQGGPSGRAPAKKKDVGQKMQRRCACARSATTPSPRDERGPCRSRARPRLGVPRPERTAPLPK